MTDDYDDYDDYDDRIKCFNCDVKYNLEDGKPCKECDEWYCSDCYNDYEHLKLHEKEELK